LILGEAALLKYRRATILSLVVFISFVSGGWFLQTGNSQGQVLQKARLFQQVVRLVADYYVDSLDQSQLYDMAIDGMMDQLNDPYTSFLRRRTATELRISTTGNYGGVGLRIDLRDGWVTVVTPMAGGPAEAAGLQSGDQIFEVEGESTEGWGTEDAANRLRGEPGSETEISISRAGYEGLLKFPLIRAQITVNSVEGTTMLSESIGYLRMTTVSEHSARDLRSAVDSLRGVGAKSLILDLRINPGGVLNQGVELADLFLERGDTIVKTRGRAPGATEDYIARRGQAWGDMPVLALVSGSTASAAEIISGALQDHDRAIILGTPTFGKGVAYFFLELTDSEALTVTSSRWYTPSGRSIQREVANAAPRSSIAQIAPVEMSDSNMVYHTDGGRPIRQGTGGIQPDLIVPRDTLSEPEQAFASALGNQVGIYRNSLSRYALEVKGRGTLTDPEFKVTEEMLLELHGQMTERGLEIERDVFLGARNLIGDQLGYDLTRFIFGREAEIRRQMKEDNQVAEAVKLLTGVTDPDDLIAITIDPGGTVGNN
jgi:carboxyl-terminal processing protease